MRLRPTPLVLAMDLLIGLSFWYLFLYLLNSIYTISGSLLTVAVLFTLRLIVSALLAIPLSSLADRVSITRAILASIAPLPLLTTALYIGYRYTSSAPSPEPTLHQLLAVAVVVEALATSYNSLKYALPPRIPSIPLEKLNAAFELSYSILLVAGPLAAAAMLHLEWLGASLAVACQAASIITLSLLRSHIRQRLDMSSNSITALLTLHDIINATQLVARDTAILRVYASILTIFFAGGIVNVALVPLASKLVSTITFAEAYAVITASIGVGSTIASITVIRKSRPDTMVRRFLPHSLLAMSIYPLLIAYTLSKDYVPPGLLALFLAASLLNGWSNSIVFIALTTLLQKLPPEEHTAKIIVLANLGGNLAAALSTIITGIASEHLPSMITMLVSSSLLLLAPIPLLNPAIHSSQAKAPSHQLLRNHS